MVRTISWGSSKSSAAKGVPHADIFGKAVEYEPNLSEPYMNLALLAEEAGQPQVAIGYYRKFLQHADPKAHKEFIPKVKAAIKGLGGD